MSQPKSIVPSGGLALQLLGVALLCAALFAVGQHVAKRHTQASLDVRGALPQVRNALQSDDRLAQAATLTPILLAMELPDVEQVAAVFEESFASGAGGGLPLELFVERLAALDPLLARDRISSWPREPRAAALPTLLRGWARVDPPTAIESLNEIPDAKIRSAAFAALIEGWVQSGHIESVWRYLAQLPGGMDRERGAQIVVSQLVLQGGADAALREIEQLAEEPPLGAFKNRVLRTAVGLVARSDPARAIEVVNAQTDEAERTSLVRRVAVNWVTQDGPAAMAWIGSQPPDAQRRRVTREVYRRWVVRDRPGALAWMADQADPVDLASIVDIYATALARSDPQAAIAWVRGIEDASLRREALVDVAEVWHHEDPQAAAAWIGELGLQDEIQRRTERRRKKIGAR